MVRPGVEQGPALRLARLFKAAVGPLLPRGSAVRRIPRGLNRGLAMEIDFSYQARMYAGIFEAELARHVRELCRPGTASFDVGAREGYYTLALAKLSRGGRVLAFDFDPDWCAHAARNVAANPQLRPRPEIRAVKVARDSDPSRGKVSLDDVAYGDGGFVPDLIKIDVEGAEVEVLHGAERILREHAPRLIVETHSPQLESECADVLADHGYRARVVVTRRWLPEVRTGTNRWLVAQQAVKPS